MEAVKRFSGGTCGHWRIVTMHLRHHQLHHDGLFTKDLPQCAQRGRRVEDDYRVCNKWSLTMSRACALYHGATRLGSPDSPHIVLVDAATCRSYRDPGGQNRS